MDAPNVKTFMKHRERSCLVAEHFDVADIFLGKFWPVHACEWDGIEWDGEGIPIISQN